MRLHQSVTQCDSWFVKYTVTMQQVLREWLDKRVVKYGRDKVAEMLGCSTANLDYLRAGFRKKKRKDGSEFLQNVSISFEHMEALAKAEDVSLAEMIKDIYLDTASMEVLTAPDATASEGRSASPSTDRQR